MWTPAALFEAGVFPWDVDKFTLAEWRDLVDAVNERQEVNGGA